MDPRATNWLFGLITIGALAFAGFMYTSNSDSASPEIRVSLAPSETPSALATTSLAPTTTPSPKASVSTSPSPSPSPSTTATARKFTASQGLSVTNQIEIIPDGGSLYAIASEYGIRSTELAKINGITDMNTVYAGQTIIIPDDVSNDTYTILFTTNTVRQEKEAKKVEAGGTSLYTDAVTAAQTDLKNIYGLDASTPYSKTDDSESSVTLSSSSDDKIVTVTMQKDSVGLWYVKKLVIKLTKKEA